MSTEDRRIDGSTRTPFEALVEIGGSLGPTFEAQAVDLSEEGMHLRTAYLPDIGQPLSCRFDSGSASVLASGEVVWRQEAGRGGEFGIRFTNLDAESVLALDRILAVARGDVPKDPGTRVRLHIEGLGSPMRAWVKDTKAREMRVGSELGFLKGGRPLELEDATTGAKRSARIDRVDVETDAASKVPQLVITLRYEDVEPAANEPASASATATGTETREITPGPSTIDDESDGDASGEPEPIPLVSAAPAVEPDPFQKESDAMKSAFGRSAAKVGPALASFARRAKTTVALLAANARRRGAEAPPTRRTTSPPPGGALHASGRRVVRGDSMTDASELPAGLPKAGSLKRKVIAGSAVAGLGLFVVLIAHRPSAPAAQPATATLAPAAVEAPAIPPPAPLPPAPVATATPSPAPDPALAGPAPLAAPAAAHGDMAANDATNDAAGKHHAHVAPFGTGSVAHANVIKLKMDGAIDKLEGATTPTGFSVRIPNRRSLEAAAPLAAKDPRIAAMHVSNEANGAELGVSFKDGVPGFQVRAKGDVLEILLAVPAGAQAEEAAETPSPRHAETAASGHHKKHHKLVHGHPDDVR